jgi:hypothetical protein
VQVEHSSRCYAMGIRRVKRTANSSNCRVFRKTGAALLVRVARWPGAFC